MDHGAAVAPEERVIPMNAGLARERNFFQTDDNANEVKKSLPVTFSDGTSTQTVGSVTHLSESPVGKRDKRASIACSATSDGYSSSGPDLEIREIGEKTFERERDRSRKSRAAAIQDPRVRRVPIRLHDRKVVLVEPEHKTEARIEVIDFSHQEYPDTVTPDEKLFAEHFSGMARDAECNDAVRNKERVIPILLEDTGETIRPSVTKLEEPHAPGWPMFNQKSKSEKATGSSTFGGARPKVPTSPACPKTSLKKRKQSAKTTPETTEKRGVRFDVGDDCGSPERDRRSSRSSSADGRPNPAPRPSGLPPKFPSRDESRGRTKTRSPGSTYRAFSTDPEVGLAGRRSKYSQDDQKTLQEIDRDITKIWKDLQELDKNSSGSERKPKFETVKVREFSIPEPASPSQARFVSAERNGSSAAGKNTSGRRTIWDMDSQQLRHETGGPNYIPPHAIRRTSFNQPGTDNLNLSRSSFSSNGFLPTETSSPLPEPTRRITNAADEGRRSSNSKPPVEKDSHRFEHRRSDKSTQTLKKEGGHKARSCNVS